jgi:hypothetical protein
MIVDGTAMITPTMAIRLSMEICMVIFAVVEHEES